jgi:hypothetical protein
MKPFSIGPAELNYITLEFGGWETRTQLLKVHVRDSPRFPAFCGLSKREVLRPSLFAECSGTGAVYLDIEPSYFGVGFLFLQDETPPFLHCNSDETSLIDIFYGRGLV